MDCNHIILGADIGGSHITTALVDLKLRQILEHTLVRELVNANGSVDEILAQWHTALIKTLQRFDGKVNQFGIAIPGPFDYENGISKIKDNAKYDALYNLNIKELLAEKLAVTKSQIKMMNDATGFLLGEISFGAAKGFNSAVGLTLGTGLGSAKYHDGICVDANLWCMPFKDGQAEDYISTRWFLKRYTELTGLQIPNVKGLASIYSTQPVVAQIFEEFSLNLAKFMCQFIKMEQPQVVVIGGNIGKIYHYFKPVVDSYLQNMKIFVSIYTSSLGENATLMGASSLWSKPKDANALI